MVKLLLDTNILQDILTNRPGANASLGLIKLAKEKTINLSISALSIPILWYLNRKLINQRPRIRNLTKFLSIIPLTEQMVKRTLAAPIFGDLEDELQYLAAKTAGAKFLITRNTRDFPVQDIDVMTPEQFIANLSG